MHLLYSWAFFSALEIIPLTSESAHQKAPSTSTSMTGWWFEPLWKIWKSLGIIIPNIHGKIKKKWQPNHQPDELFPKIHGKTSWVSDQAWEHFGKSHKFRTTLLAGQVTEPSKPPGAGLTDWQGPLRVGRLFQGSAAFVYQDLTHS